MGTEESITFIDTKAAVHHTTAAELLKAGCASAGVKFSSVVSPRGLSIEQPLACWGWRIGQELKRRGFDVLVMERGYVGDRFKWTSMAWNGLNNGGVFAQHPDGYGRFEKHHGHLKPWRTEGSHIILAGQVPGDMSLQGRDLSEWYEVTAQRLLAKYGKRVIYRPHPETLRRGMQRWAPTSCSGLDIATPLAKTLQDAFALVCWNSNASVDAVLAGVPAITADQGAMAWEVTSHVVLDPLLRPPREAWAARLAGCQWLPDEISSGEAIRALLAARPAR